MNTLKGAYSISLQVTAFAIFTGIWPGNEGQGNGEIQSIACTPAAAELLLEDEPPLP